MVYDLEIIVVVEHVEVVDDVLIGDVLAAEAHHLVKDGECVAQGAVGLLRDDIQGFGFGVDAFALGHKNQVLGDVVDGDALEVKDLAAREYGRDDFVLLSRGENELGIRGRLLESLQEGVEGRRREHVHLVDDVDLVLPDLGRNPHLVHKVTDVIHRVVRRRVEFVNVERGVVVEGTA